MRPETERLWTRFLSRFDRIAVYTADPGAHAIALELVPLVEKSGRFIAWFAEGWSARQTANTQPAERVFSVLRPGDTLIVGSRVDFHRTHEILHEAAAREIKTVFVFDHWKNFGNHFRPGDLPDAIVVLDETAKRAVLSELGETAAERVTVLPHLGLEAAVDRVGSFQLEPARIVAILLDPTEPEDGLGYDWRSTLEAARMLARQREGFRFLVKPHPRQNIEAVERKLSEWPGSELFRGETEWLIAAASEIWGMTSIVLNISLAAGKPIRSLQIGRSDAGVRASNYQIEPFVITELGELT